MVGVAVNCSWREPPRALFTLLFFSHSLTLYLVAVSYSLSIILRSIKHLCLRLNSTSLPMPPQSSSYMFFFLSYNYLRCLLLLLFYSKHTYIPMY